MPATVKKITSIPAKSNAGGYQWNNSKAMGWKLHITLKKGLHYVTILLDIFWFWNIHYLLIFHNLCYTHIAGNFQLWLISTRSKDSLQFCKENFFQSFYPLQQCYGKRLRLPALPKPMIPESLEEFVNLKVNFLSFREKDIESLTVE